MRALLVAARRDERGAVVPIVAVLIGLLITVTAFTVDLGTQRVARTDMQSLADLVALDASRSLGGQTTSVLLTGGTFATGVVASVGRNSTTVGAKPKLLVEIGTYAGTTFTPSGSLRYTAGDAAVSAVTITTGTTVPTAVRVSTGTTTSFSFVPGTGAANRSAVAVTDSSACFEVGSYAAAVRSSDSALLTRLLNGALGLGVTAAGYQGLATSSIKLADLAAALGVGSVQQLATTTVTAGALDLAIAQVLSANGEAANAAVVQTLATSVRASSSVAVGSLLGIDTGMGSVASAKANVLDLVSAAAFLVNGTNLASLSVPISVPGLASATVSGSVIQGLQKACGRVGTQATTSQVALTYNVTLGPSIDVAGLGTVTLGSPANAPIVVQAAIAPSTATLAAVTCTTPASSVQGATIGTVSSVGTITATIPVTVQTSLPLGLLGALVSVTVSTTATLTTTISQNTATTTISIAPQAFDTAYSTGTGSITLNGSTAVPSATGTTVTALGLTLTSSLTTTIINTALVPTLAAIVNSLSQAIVTPLTTLLGVRVAGADVILDSAPPLSCSVPSLRQ